MAAPAKPDATLKHLVSLRRQRAEQDFAAAKADLRETEVAIEALRAQLAAIDTSDADYADRALSQRYGHTALLMGQIAEKRETLTRKQAAFEAARDALRKALYSEDRIATG